MRAINATVGKIRSNYAKCKAGIAGCKKEPDKKKWW
jgi:hypothetical protein